MGMFLNLVTSPTASQAVSNSVFQVMSEGTLKAVGRPTFTLMDKKADPEVRKYSAIKEFIYQTLCLSFYFAIVSPALKGAYKLLKKMKTFKDDPGFKFDSYKQLNNAPKNPNLIRAKGAMTAVSILVSAVTLTILAPQVVRKALHPIMNLYDKKMQEKQLKKEAGGDTFQKTKEA